MLTIATTRESPKHIPHPSTQEKKLLFTTSFKSTRKIDVFLVGDIKPISECNDPNDLDLSSLTISLANLNPTHWGLSEEQAILFRKLEQLGLGYSLLVSDRLVLLPGQYRSVDQKITAILRAALSDNITNPDEVIQEYITLWNEVAALPVSQPNIGKSPDTDEAEKPFFSCHENYLDTLKTIAQQFAQSMHHSDTIQQILKKLAITPGNMARSMEYELKPERLAEMLLNDFTEPKPADFFSIELSQHMMAVMQQIFNETEQPIKFELTKHPAYHASYPPGHVTKNTDLERGTTDSVMRSRYQNNQDNKDARNRSRSPVVRMLIDPNTESNSNHQANNNNNQDNNHINNNNQDYNSNSSNTARKSNG